ncbi:hypothetical protein [Acidisoma sp. C75]
MFPANSEGKPRQARVQPTAVTGSPRAGRRSAASSGLLLALLLGGCAGHAPSANPVSWWHNLEGGEIAQDRPPPPLATAPYPHIAANPVRPAGMPDWEWQDLQATLAAQGAAAHQYAAENPIPALSHTAPIAATPGAAPPSSSSPVASTQDASTQGAGGTPTRTTPVKSAAGTPSPAAAAETAQMGGATGTSMAVTPGSDADAAAIRRLAAAQGPAGAAAALPPAATVAAATAAAEQPPGAAGSGTPNGAGSGITFDTPTPRPSGAGPAQVPVTASGKLASTTQPFDANNGLSVPGALAPETPLSALQAGAPALPHSVPAPPAVPGFAIPVVPSTYAPPKAAPEPAAYQPPPPLPDVPPVLVSFPAGTARLSPPMQRALRKLLDNRGSAHIAVVGFGDAPSSALAAQSAALPLALERARAILVQLRADGVSAGEISTSAEAEGSGGLVRLVD